MQRKNGYTLVELMISGAMIGIVGVVGTFGYMGFKALHKYISTPKITEERANVISDNRAESFIEFNGKHWYSEVDGKPVADYFQKK